MNHVYRDSRTVYILSKNSYLNHFKKGGLLVLDKIFFCPLLNSVD